MILQLVQSTNPATHNAMSPFFNKLAAEVRLEIYKALFLGCEYPAGSIFDIPDCFDYDLYYARARKNRAQKRIISILQVCSQSRSEATPVFQALVTTVLFTDGYFYLARALGSYGLDRSRLKRVEIFKNWWTAGSIKTLQWLFPALQTLGFTRTHDTEIFCVDIRYHLGLPDDGTFTKVLEDADSRKGIFDALLESYLFDVARMASLTRVAAAACRPEFEIYIDIPIIFVDREYDCLTQTDGGVSIAF